MRRRLYLDFTGRKRNPAGMRPYEGEIVPGFETIKGLNMVDAATVQLTRSSTAEQSPARDD